MLYRSNALLVLAAGRQQLVLRACQSHFTTLSRDIEDANRELDEFFGVSNSSCNSKSPNSSSAHKASSATDGRTAIPAPSSSGRQGPYAQDTGSGSLNSDILDPRWDVSASYGFSASTANTPEPGWRGAAAQAQPLPQQPRALTHIDASGSAAMVDVSQKGVTVREAQASCMVSLGDAFDLVAANSVAKGDVLKVAQLAGICGAKATASLIPLCHNIPISKVDVQLQLDAASRTVAIRALARTDGKTGVEMEALTAASVAALTVYDMCKAAAKDMVVGQLQLDYKSGGRSGTYLRDGLRRSDLLPSARPPL